MNKTTKDFLQCTLSSILRYFPGITLLRIIYPRLLQAFISRNSPSFKRLARLLDPSFLNIRSHQYYVQVKCDGASLKADINDHLGYKIHCNGFFDRMLMHCASRLALSASDVILDVGANIGSVSIPVCKRYGCSLICFEASHSIASVLCHNIYINQVNAVTFVCGLSSYSSSDFSCLYASVANIGQTSLDSGWISIENQNSGISKETTRLATADSILNDHPWIQNLKILKIDIEGHELQAFQGLKSIISSTLPLIIFESSGGSSLLQIHRFFEPLGYRLFIPSLSYNPNQSILVERIYPESIQTSYTPNILAMTIDHLDKLS